MGAYSPGLGNIMGTDRNPFFLENAERVFENEDDNFFLLLPALLTDDEDTMRAGS
jgi:hypothetical protein